MLRKSRFGSKTGRNASRDTEQSANEDPDGSDSSSNDSEGVSAEKEVDRYERSSDRYRAASIDRAGADKSAPARRSLGNSLSKGKYSSGLSSRTSKAEAIAAGARVNEQGMQEDAEPVYERSSDRALPKRHSAFGGGGLGRPAAKVSANKSDDIYERSSDKKFGRGSSSVRKSSFSTKASTASTSSADDEDVFERSTERTAARKSAFSNNSRESGPASSSASRGRQQSEAKAIGPNPTGPNPVDRLELARASIERAVFQTPAKSTASNSSAITGEFEPADPFEPFEQCIPAAADTESVCSRGAGGRGKPSVAEEIKRKRPQLSLRGRALGYLSRREHSRAELSRKLTPHLTETDSLDTLLDALEREGWLSNERFVESIVHRRGPKLGTNRIVNELKRNGIDEALIQDTNAALKDTELTRAREIWSKKYGELPVTPADRARQARFLATRGFTSGVIVKVLKSSDDDFNVE